MSKTPKISDEKEKLWEAYTRNEAIEKLAEKKTVGESAQCSRESGGIKGEEGEILVALEGLVDDSNNHLPFVLVRGYA